MEDSPEHMVCHILGLATDQNHEVVKKAEAQLSEWELQSGFFPTLARLLDAQTSQQLAVNVRWMAVVVLKNGVDKYWRRCIPAHEKKQIRDILLTNIATEPVSQVASQIAVLIARIARFDCPREWPELVPELMKRLEANSYNNSDGNNLTQQNVLLVLHHVVKALASRRVMPEKRLFEELTSNIFVYIYDLWNSFTTLFFQQLNSTPPSNCVMILERALLTIRILRKLIIFGFKKPHIADCSASECCMRLIEQMFTRLKECMECRYELKRLNVDEQLIELLEKFMLKQIKILNEFQKSYSLSFTRFVPMALEFSFHHVFHDGAHLIFTDNVINFKSFAIHCMNLIKGIVLCRIYATVNGNTKDPLYEPLPIALSDFFTNERLTYICEKIITHYFLLTQIELETWDDDPEGFAKDDTECWRYALRPCVESLYLTFFNEYQTHMTTEVLKYVQKSQQTQLTATSDLKDILLKDAIYNAIGLVSSSFYHDIDFDNWFSNQLLAELRIVSDNFRILRRRIIWLVSKWANVKLSRDMRPLAYEACLHLLRSNEDMSIRLAASCTLSTLVSDFDFAPEQFLPYLEPGFNGLFLLLREARECDTKMNVLNSMSALVEKMSDQIESQIENLLTYLPLLWKESEDYDMLRCAIICTLQQLVKAKRDIPESLKPFLYSTIELSTNIEEPSFVYLSEEGLQLWLTVVENSTSNSAELLNLSKHLLPIIEMSSEHLRMVLSIIEAYILLDDHSFFERYGRQFIDFCRRMLVDIRPEGILIMCKVFEICLITDPNYGLELVRPVLPYIFNQVYLNELYPMLLGMYLSIVARVLLINQNEFTNIMQEMQLQNTFEKILDVMITKMPLVTETERRKLFCLAFSSIFTNNKTLLERFPGIMQNISATLSEIMHLDDDKDSNDSNEETDVKINAIAINEYQTKNNKTKVTKYCDSLVFIDEQDLVSSSFCRMEDFDYKSYHFDRCRQLALKDPVHKIVLTEFLEWQLNSLHNQMGNDAYQQLMQSVYIPVLKNMQQYVKLNLNFELKEQ